MICRAVKLTDRSDILLGGLAENSLAIVQASNFSVRTAILNRNVATQTDKQQTLFLLSRAQNVPSAQIDVRGFGCGLLFLVHQTLWLIILAGLDTARWGFGHES
jgi:hypothetical protein